MRKSKIAGIIVTIVMVTFGGNAWAEFCTGGDFEGDKLAGSWTYLNKKKSRREVWHFTRDWEIECRSPRCMGDPVGWSISSLSNIQIFFRNGEVAEDICQIASGGKRMMLGKFVFERGAKKPVAMEWAEKPTQFKMISSEGWTENSAKLDNNEINPISLKFRNCPNTTGEDRLKLTVVINYQDGNGDWNTGGDEISYSETDYLFDGASMTMFFTKNPSIRYMIWDFEGRFIWEGSHYIGDLKMERSILEKIKYESFKFDAFVLDLDCDYATKKF